MVCSVPSSPSSRLSAAETGRLGDLRGSDRALYVPRIIVPNPMIRTAPQTATTREDHMRTIFRTLLSARWRRAHWVQASTSPHVAMPAARRSDVHVPHGSSLSPAVAALPARKPRTNTSTRSTHQSLVPGHVSRISALDSPTKVMMLKTTNATVMREPNSVAHTSIAVVLDERDMIR